MSDSKSDRAMFTLEDLRDDVWTGDEDLTAFVADLERAYVSSIDHETELRHISLISNELRSASWEPKLIRSASWAQAGVRRPVRRRRFRLAMQLATALASATVFVGGFAFAHVGGAEESLGHATATGGGNGVVVGSQGRPASVEALLGYIDTTADEGCVFGQSVAAIATQGGGSNADACSQGQSQQGAASGHSPQGSRATGDEHSAGRAGGTGAQGSRATGDEHSAGRAGGTGAQGSRATGDEHSADQAEGAGGDGAQGSQVTGVEHSGGTSENVPVDIPKGPPTDL